MKLSQAIFGTCLIVSIVLLVIGFIVPPTGVIDGSVLTAVGTMFGFATLGQLPTIIHGREVEIKHGNTSLTIGDDDK